MTRKNIGREVEIAAGRNIEEYRYWMEKLAGEPVGSCFPVDYKKTETGKTERISKMFRLTDDIFSGLNKLGKGSPYTLHIIFLTVVAALLGRYTGSGDILIGTPIYRQETEDEFINTMLVIRNRLHGGMTFKELLTRMKRTVLEAVEHQAYPVELLPYKLGLPVSDPCLNEKFPLFDVVVLVREIHDKTYLRSIQPNFTFSFERKQGYIEGELEYNSSGYFAATVERILDHFSRLLQKSLVNPDSMFCDMDFLSEEEKKQLLFGFNDTSAAYPLDKTVRDLFEEQVEKRPHHNALVGPVPGSRKMSQQGRGTLSRLSAHFTYRKLDREAESLSHVLVDRGVKADTIVGIMAERSLEMLAGILAVIKAGGAYLPIDPGYPEQRKLYMLQDSSAKILLIAAECDDGALPLKNLQVERIFIDEAFNRSYSAESGVGARRAVPGKTSALGFSGAASRTHHAGRGSDIHENQSLIPSMAHRAAGLAYIIYTSGTTGKPKGAMIEHKNIVRLMFNDRFLFDFSHRDIWTIFHSYCFDFSVWEMYGALLYGGQLVVISKMDARDTRNYLEILRKKNVTILNQTPSSFYNIADLELNEPGQALNLRYIIFGGEALNPVRLKGWKAKYPGTKIINMYGITETTVHVTFKEIGDKEIESGISNIGKPIPTLNTYVVNEYFNLVPVGSAGEMVVGGDGVSRGYLNKPELTREKFIPNPFVSNERLYRSGDLVKLTLDGEMEYLGRIDHQVQIRGFRVELGEIESHLLRHKDIKEAVVIVRKYDNSALHTTGAEDMYICAYIIAENSRERIGDRRKKTGYPDESMAEFAGTPTGSELKHYLSRMLPDYMIPSYFVHLESIPLTANGKVDRKALPEPGIDRAGVDRISPRDETEEKLAAAWSEVLGIEKDVVGIDDNFFDLGGHSLKAAILMARLRKEFDTKAALEEIFKTPTIRDLAEYFKSVGAAAREFLSIEPAEKKESYPLSSAQRRLYILQEMERDNIVYNIPAVYVLEGKFDREKLEDTFKKMIARHESLRTSFEMKEGDPVQRIIDPERIEFHTLVSAKFPQKTFHEGQGPRPVSDVGARRAVPSDQEPRGAARFCVPPSLLPEIIDSFIRPFDLSQAPLFRVGLAELAAEAESPGDKHILVFDMHHIISDGISTGLFAKEFMALYAGAELIPLRLHYKDYSLWQNSEQVKESLKEQEEYWLNRFSGEIPVLYLPTDYPRPATRSFAGSSVAFEIDRMETAALNKIAKEQGGTLYMIMLAVFNILLAKISGQEDIVVGTAIAGRMHTDLERIIGMFVNTLPLRNYPFGDKSFIEFAVAVKERALQSFENQEYPFEDLVDKAAVNRDAGRNPIFDVMFVFQNIEVEYGDIPAVEIPGLSLKSFKYKDTLSKFDLNFTGIEAGEKLLFSVNYCTELFKKETIDRFIVYTRRIAAAVTRDTGLKLYEIEILSEEERKVILYEFNDNRTEYPHDKTIQQLFEEQAAKTPGNIAVIDLTFADRDIPGEGQEVPSRQPVHLTYRELNRQAESLSRVLLEWGVRTGTIAGIMVDRSAAMLAGVLAILKAGGAYLPINPGYPGQRKLYMLRDSGARLLLTAGDPTRVGGRLGGDDSKMEAFPVSELQFGENGCTRRVPKTFDEGARLAPAHDGGQPQGLPLHTTHRPPVPLEGARAACLAYVIYTSGSTGQPKGVMVDHYNVVRLVKNTDYMEFRPGDRVLPTGALEFDASTFEIWGSLLNGLKLCLVNDGVILSSSRLKEAILKNKITTMWLTSPLFNQLLQEDTGIFRGLCNLLVGGDVLSPSHIERLREKYPALNIINGYGPTENTTFSTTHLIAGTYSGNIPIGKPIANSTAYIVDRFGNPRPLGIPGELLVGGAGVARGYLNRPELTHEKFLRSFFQKATPRRGHYVVRGLDIHENQLPVPLEGARAACYKTGDLARWLPGGNIEFIGRIDHQVKIRGFRIELGEIEDVLLRYDGIKEAVVIDWERQPGQKALCAYVVPAGEIDAAAARDYLAKELPDYMIPAYVTALKKIPLTGNGKVDRKKLPPPQLNIGGGYVEPRNDNEKLVADTWKEVLGLDKIGIHHNFFDLGGSSIDFIKLNSRLKEELNRDIPLTMMFRYPTVATFGQYLSEEDFTRIIDRSAEKKLGANRLEKMRNLKKRRSTR